MYFNAVAIRIMEPKGPGVIAVELWLHIDDILQTFFDELLIKGLNIVYHKRKCV